MSGKRLVSSQGIILAWTRHEALFRLACHQQAAAAGLRRADDLPSAVEPDVGWDSECIGDFNA